MSSQTNLHRRRRSEIEDEEEADNVRSSQSPTPSTDSSRRGRRNPHTRDSSSESPERDDSRASVNKARRSTVNRAFVRGNNEDEVVHGEGEFQPGAIVRVKLTNFVTYSTAEFFPGPNLNMVIGPNGTGKSSLVCAICLGLGWGPQHLGRATQIGEFVKHGLSEAYVEIELQRRPNEPNNHVVRVKIIRDGNGREWWLNGRKTSLKAVQTLTRSLSIQIDNLCQFLPQDKVSEFAALSPVELLLQTQRAAAPEQMLEWHEKLKELRKDQKALQDQHGRDRENLETLETRQGNLRAEVQRLEERNQIQEKVKLLRHAVPFVEYRDATARFKSLRKEKREAADRLNELRAQVEPTLQSVTHKKAYRNAISTVVKERKKSCQVAEQAADKLLIGIEKLDENIGDIEEKAQGEKRAEDVRKKDILRTQKKISQLKTRIAQEPPIEFNGTEFNNKTTAKQRESNNMEIEGRELQAQEKELRERGQGMRNEEFAIEQELLGLDSQEGQLLSKVQALSEETAKAWKWVQDNRDSFEQEVYGPPVISCSIKDPKYTAAIEILLGKNDILAITAQTKNDLRKLNDHLNGTLNLADIQLRLATDTLAEHSTPMPASDLQRYGLEGWAIDYIDGPEPVLSMLCGSKKLQESAVSLKDITEDQHNQLVQSKQCRGGWVAGSHLYRINSRSEYGAQATSTTTRYLGAPKWWTDRPVDSSAKQELQAKLDDIKQRLDALKQEILPIRDKIKELKAAREELQTEIGEIKAEKAERQNAYTKQKELPRTLEREEDILAEKMKEGASILEETKKLKTQLDHLILRKANKALDHKESVMNIKLCHEQLLEAEIRLIEAISDVESLEEQNLEIVQRLAEEQRLVKEAEQQAAVAKSMAEKALIVVKAILAEVEPDSQEYLTKLPAEMTVESLEIEIAAEESKLDYIHANNPNAIRDFEKRQQEVERLKEKIVDTEEKLERSSKKITKIRSDWEPQLDALVSEISDAFAFNFEQIGCAGEVSVYKDDDFDQWAIQIKVRFREDEALQILDSHRQSGGERSVSTIFYLMSLQSLARAPFRVVDEINQGMDKRNERMVHERMVQIACQEHTSQYFLITPKLLDGLRYDKRMRVLCITSGEYMPEDHKKMDVSSVLAIRRAMVAAG